MNNLIDHSTLAEISGLNEELLILQRQGSLDPETFFKADVTELERVQSRLAYLGRLVRWYESRVKEVLSLVEGDVVLQGNRRFDGHSEAEVANGQDLALEVLRNLTRSQTIDSVLGPWVHQLANRGLLTAEAASQLDLTAPVDEERAKRRQEQAQREADYQAGVKKLREAALAYAAQNGNDWGHEDYRQAYHSRIGGWSHDEEGLLGQARALGQRKLLPVGDRIGTSISDLWLRLRQVVA